MAKANGKQEKELKAADRKVAFAKSNYDSAVVERAALIMTMREEGLSLAAIARALSKSVSRVRQIIEREQAA